MDKIKPILAGLLKYHFWVLLGIVIVIALFTWNSAVGRLDQDFTQNKGAIDSQFSKIDSLTAQMVEVELAPGQVETRFANQQWQEDTLQRAEVLKGEVEAAWRSVYDRQRATRAWPDIPPDSSAKVGGFMESNPPETPIPAEAVEAYRQVMAAQVAELPQLVSAAPIPEFDPKAKPGRRPPVTAEPVESPMTTIRGVHWNAANFHAIQARLTPPKEPTTGWAVQAQEDIWVYRLLLGAIEKCNGPADQRDEYNLPINRINFIDLGTEVSRAMDVGSKVMPFDDPAYKPPTAAPAAGEPAFNLEQETADQQPKKPVEKKTYGRYYEGEKSAVGFKSLPVRLGVEMKLQKLPQLMLELANADLTTEIVDIYIKDPRGIHSGDTMPSAGRSGHMTPGGEWGGEPGRRGSLPVSSEELSAVTSTNPSVEIWALVHFAELPDKKALMSKEQLAAEAEKEKQAAKAQADKNKKAKGSDEADDE